MMNVVSVLVENKHGALLRVAGVLAAVGINIERLSVCPASEPGVSRIALAFDFEPARVDLIVKKIERLVHVVKAERLTGEKAASPELWECACTVPVWAQRETGTLSA